MFVFYTHCVLFFAFILKCSDSLTYRRPVLFRPIGKYCAREVSRHSLFKANVMGASDFHRKMVPREGMETYKTDLQDSSDNLAEINSLKKEIKEVERKIVEREGEIEHAAVKIESATGDMLQYWIKEKEDLCKKEADLRKEKDDLQDYHRKISMLLLQSKLEPQVVASSPQKATDIQVPSSLPFVRGIADCTSTQILISKAGCSLDKLADIDSSVEEGLAAIKREAPVEANTFLADYRCSPIVYPRLARGGKSTFLASLFRELKEDAQFVPVLISFNGNCYVPRPGETARSAIVRAIASLLVDMPDDESIFIDCNERKLLEHIAETAKGKIVVLMIDELNQLGVPLEPAASNFLKKNFLDAKNRSLVFTTHLPINMEHQSKGNVRFPIIVPLPTSKDISLLKAMGPHCESLTPVEAAIYGYIPSLIYSLKRDRSTFENRVRSAALSIPTGRGEKKRQLVGAFVRQLLDGDMIAPDVDTPWMSKLRQFDIFGSIQETDRIQFCIGYIAAILDKLDFVGGTKFCEWLRVLLTHAKSVDSGKDWVIVVQFAVMLRCLEACLKEQLTFSPINLLNDASEVEKLIVKQVSIPGDYSTADDAKVWLEKIASKTKLPTLLIATPSHSSFEVFDMLVCLHVPGKPLRAMGIQCKLGRGTPSTNSIVPAWIEQVYLFRGKAKKSETQEGKWTYFSKEDVETFLGYSLRPLLPDNWESL